MICLFWPGSTVPDQKYLFVLLLGWFIVIYEIYKVGRFFV
jgi:hypothetical protein